MCLDEGDSRRCHFKLGITGAAGVLGDTFTGVTIHKGNTLLVFDAHHDTLLRLFSVESNTLLMSSHRDTTQSCCSAVTQAPFTQPIQCGPVVLAYF